MIKSSCLLAFIVLTAGCAVKIAPYNPASGDSLSSYAKELSEANKYHINTRIRVDERQGLDMQDAYRKTTYIDRTTSHLFPSVYIDAMKDACTKDGGAVENLGGVYNQNRSDHQGYKNYGFICRMSLQAVLVKAVKAIPDKLGSSYIVVVIERYDPQSNFSDEI